MSNKSKSQQNRKRSYLHRAILAIARQIRKENPPEPIWDSKEKFQLRKDFLKLQHRSYISQKAKYEHRRKPKMEKDTSTKRRIHLSGRRNGRRPTNR